MRTMIEAALIALNPGFLLIGVGMRELWHEMHEGDSN